MDNKRLFWLSLSSSPRLSIHLVVSSEQALDDEVGVDALTLLELLGWVAADNRHWGDILDDNAATANDGSPADTAATGQNEDVGGYPDVILDDNAVMLVLPIRRIDVV